MIANSAPRPDSSYAWLRLVLALGISTIAGVGMWAVVVVLPDIQSEFGVARGAASLPYTVMMLGFAFGTIVLGQMSDRTGIVVPIIIAGVSLGAGFGLAALAPSLLMVSLLHFLVGMGSGAGFAPMMADISHWFVKRRGVAVVIIASGNYLAGSIWPLFMNQLMPSQGWRGTYLAIAAICVVTILPLAFLMRRRPEKTALDAATEAAAAAQADLGLSPRALQMLLVVAGFSCCVAMSMPQVHIVAYCGDLGYGVARGAEMLSLMLFLGIASRIGSGFLADRIGGAATLLIGSIMQGVALVLYLFFNGLASLYIISGIFGLFQGGIVPMYAVICREFLPAREAGSRIGLVMASTIIGMAFGGYVSGLIYDATNSYRLAFLNGVIWNGLNLLVVAWLFMKRQKAMPQPA
ncbi:MAG: MFS transporter [Hyphomicrobiales bacterium]|nr:MFS transporter [Methylobacterium sp.]MCE2932099.1 MFS transporter [Hyphomicrobiales bacterium]MCZ8269221.1 MFS transporter [Beijerinckiaceae bacterium]MCA3638682.1 MFS transporter [Methylobacterium sp.]MCA3643074.1 MFS transporter [Methylobacterium sp.]